MKFNVTFERYTPESIEQGDASESGHLVQGVGLREALEYIRDEPSPRCSLAYIEPSASWLAGTRWITWHYGADYESGESVALSLHLPDTMTNASKARLLRLLTN